MSLPSSWGTVRVYGTYTLRDGEPAVGSVIFHSPQIVVVGGVTIVPRNIVCELDEDGFFEYDLPSTDDPDIAPDGWVYTVRERFDGGGGRAAYEISVPLAGGDINLATVAPAISVDEKSALELWQLADVHDDAEDPDNNDVLVWNDTTKRWVPSASVPGSATWGGITGTLSDQADLQAALDAKAPLSSPTFTGTPAAPTAAGGTSTTQIATTAFVGSAVSTHAGATDPHGDRAYTDTQIAGRQAASATLTTLSSATAAGLALMDDATAADQRTTLGLGTAATHNVPASGDAASGEVVKGNDTRLDVAATVHAATAASLADADEQGFWQSASSALRKITWSNIKSTLKTYFDTLYQAALVSGTNIKTVNSNSLLGSGDIAISASPGGSDTQVQFNDGGTLAGNSGFTFNKTNNTINLGGATVTASYPVLDLSQTWNNSGVAFTGLKFNVTNTASSSSSKLLDLQAGGVTQAAVRSDGVLLVKTVSANTTGANAFLRLTGHGGGYGVTMGASTDDVYAGQQALRLTASSYFGWTSSTSLAYAGTVDIYLYRDAAGVLAQRNGTNAQTLRVYRSYTDASNYSRWTVKWNTSTAVLHAEGAGTGTDGSVAFNDAALATNATVGFLMIPSCAGTPTGTPADIPTGQSPIVYDSTNKKLCVWDGAAWVQTAALT